MAVFVTVCQMTHEFDHGNCRFVKPSPNALMWCLRHELCVFRYLAAVDTQQRTWSPIYVFATQTGLPVGITAARPVYAPYTRALLGVVGLDFVLSSVEDVINSFISTTGMIAYILDGDSSLMIGASIVGISTTSVGQVDVLECGVPEIEVSVCARAPA